MRSLVDGLGFSLGFCNLESRIQEWLIRLRIHSQLHVFGHLSRSVVHPPDGSDDQLVQCSPYCREDPNSSALLLGDDDCPYEQGGDQPDQSDHEDNQDEQHGEGSE